MGNAALTIENGNAVLGIELGSTRIKAVAIDSDNQIIATGAFDWENQLVDGIWTYSMETVKEGLASCYANLKQDIMNKHGVYVSSFKAIGISAMMHGYIALDANGQLLVPFRTWRNTITKQASEQLSDLFSYPIPERWSIAHLYQSIIENQKHIPQIKGLCTLSAYVHRLLSDNFVIGIGDASGMFPIDIDTHDYNQTMIDKFESLDLVKHHRLNLRSLLPKALLAGEPAGTLTAAGAKLLDPSGELKPGIPLCPPEGDAGTGMVATNSVRKRTGNVSAGTSVFAMVVLEKMLRGYYHQSIDLVTTPDGSLVAMSHGNNCTGEYDKWISMLGEAAKLMGGSFTKAELYDKMLCAALEGEKDCGGLMAYNYISGEHMTGITDGRPLFMRKPNSTLSLSNFMRTQLFTSLGAIRIGMEMLMEKEGISIDRMTGHGGFFKTPKAGQTVMGAALQTPITVMNTAGEGGAWGIALLASYMVSGGGMELPDFLDDKAFKSAGTSTLAPSKEDIAGFNEFMKKYKACLPVERAASECFD